VYDRYDLSSLTVLFVSTVWDSFLSSEKYNNTYLKSQGNKNQVLYSRDPGFKSQNEGPKIPLQANAGTVSK
jgi:hypothetical protein